MTVGPRFDAAATRSIAFATSFQNASGSKSRMARRTHENHDERIAALEAALAAERSARAAAELALAGSERRLHDVAEREQAAIVRIARLSVGHGDLSLQEMLAHLTETASATLSVERTSVWLLSEDHRSLCCLDLYEKGPGAHSAGMVLIAEAYPRYFEALETGRAIDAHDAVSDSRTSEFAEGYLKPLGISSMMDAAIRRDGGLVGVVCHEHVGPPRVWQPDELSFAGALGDQVALVLAADERRRLEREAVAARRELHAAQELARHDELTHLYTRRAMGDILADETARAARYGRQLSLLMMDFDHFKDVNDRHGHVVGDEVLAGFADVLRRHARRGDLPARLGGDEFAVLLPQTGVAHAFIVAERVRKAVEALPLGRAAALPVTVSVGAASFRGKAIEEAAELVREADEALYRAKAEGRNRVALTGLVPRSPSE